MTDASDIDRIVEWDDVLDDSSYYEILGLLPIADGETIRVAFRQFALAFHPDMHQGLDQDVEPRLHRVFQRGAEAYRVLSSGDLRLRYDMGLEKGQLRLPQAEIPRHASIPAPARPLVELCKSAGAKACAKKATLLIDEGDLAGAKLEIERAIEFDGFATQELRERLDALEVALFAMGG
ncbi:MAG: J domain-containing protein [Myxococcales bacterium]|nr:J domain-containing protein [Myxococcales bacterium]